MWVKMKTSCINSEKGYLERNKSYNIPKELAEEFIENNVAEKKSE